MRWESVTGNELIEAAQADFEGTALSLYHYQAQQNELYKEYIRLLGNKPVRHFSEIPYLPISFFKSHNIRSGQPSPSDSLFESSGTTGTQPSRHFVQDLALYDAVSLAGFQQYYGSPAGWTILALLPSYLERKTSSLVHMAAMLMAESGQAENGFYLHEWHKLQHTINTLLAQNKKVLLLGVTFALLDFAEQYPAPWAALTVMETGGMKGRKEEWTRQQVHQFLKEKWQIPSVHSEYGMTELLSQAYASADGLLQPIPTLRASIRSVQDPLENRPHGSGVLNLADLANIHSCSFIATEDLGIVLPNGQFQVLGRLDFAALRGCSLMAL